jgi:hypothetical protein
MTDTAAQPAPRPRSLVGLIAGVLVPYALVALVLRLVMA